MILKDKDTINTCQWNSSKKLSEMSELELADEAYESFLTLNDYLASMNRGDISFEPPSYVSSKIMDIIYLLPETGIHDPNAVMTELKAYSAQYPKFMNYQEIDKWNQCIDDVKCSFADLFFYLTNAG